MLTRTLYSTLISYATVLGAAPHDGAVLMRDLDQHQTETVGISRPIDLVLERPYHQTLGPRGSVTHRVVLREAGLVTVLVDGSGDLVLRLRDAMGNELGASDCDLNERLGREVISIPVTSAGAYWVEVDEIGGDGSEFVLKASHTPFEPLNGRDMLVNTTVTAETLTPNTTVVRTIHERASAEGEYFVLVPARDGLLTILTNAIANRALDLMLSQIEAPHRDSEVLRHADDDLGDDTAREALTIAVRANEPIYLHVGVLSAPTRAQYRLTTELR